MQKKSKIPLVYKVSNKAIERDEITFEDLKEIFKELEIDSIYRLSEAKKDQIKLPGIPGLEKLCKKKTGKSLTDFFNFEKYTTKPPLIEEIQGKTFVTLLKQTCLELGIESLEQLIKARKLIKKEFPSGERIKKAYGDKYFEEVLEIEPGTFEYFSEQEAKEICIEQGVLFEEQFFEFIRYFNKHNTVKIPPEISSYNNSKWDNFLALNKIPVLNQKSLCSMELYTFKLLHERGIDFEVQKSFFDDKLGHPLVFDFYIPKEKVAIELFNSKHGKRFEELYNGIYNTVSYKQEYFEQRRNYCKRNKITFIRIPEFRLIGDALHDFFEIQNIKIRRKFDLSKCHESEEEILNSNFSLSAKVKLMLLCREHGYCNLSDKELIEKTDAFSLHFYKLKKELQNANLISRTEEDKVLFKQKEIVNKLFSEGKSIEQVKNEAEVTRYSVLFKNIFAGGNEVKFDSDQERDKYIVKLFFDGTNYRNIAKYFGLDSEICLSIVLKYRIDNNFIKISKQTAWLIEEIISLRSKKADIKSILKQLRINQREFEDYFRLLAVLHKDKLKLFKGAKLTKFKDFFE